MTTVFALAMLAGSPSALAYEDSVQNSKVAQYENQIQMKSYLKKDKDSSNKNTPKKNRKFKKVMNTF